MRHPWQLTRNDILVSNQRLTFEKNDYKVGDQTITDYFLLHRQPFVMVIAQATDGIVLIQQYRPATNRLYWSLPAGYLDRNEDAVAAAARELREETGAIGRDFVHIGSFDPLPAYLSSTAHVVSCTLADDKARLWPADEEVEAVALRSWPEIVALIESGEMGEMQAIAALLWCRLRGEARTGSPRDPA